ncbi:uncharacterized protein LOC123865210 [Maniola jurtina]|uniref:uncharacterized protein LOC123865210 n=1 Tax=Maniola jurtina TaxID=191418 RepID=UPI001E689826|nr:uncharacterized protein LOC123865210 [Maniola jurtina]
MSDSETFDTDMFIEEIRNLPCIWDQRTEEYSNRILKNKAWETLCMKFYEDFDNKETKEKNQCAANLQRKWKSLRDSFNRDLKKQNSQRSGSAGSSKRYYYFSQLLFLKPLSENRNTTSSLPVQNKDDDIEQIDNEDDNTTETSDSEVWKRPKNIQRKKDDAEYGLIKKITSHLSDQVTAHTSNYTTQERDKSCDSDMHFLLSLYDRNIECNSKISYTYNYT